MPPNIAASALVSAPPSPPLPLVVHRAHRARHRSPIAPTAFPALLRRRPRPVLALRSTIPAFSCRIVTHGAWGPPSTHAVSAESYCIGAAGQEPGKIAKGAGGGSTSRSLRSRAALRSYTDSWPNGTILPWHAAVEPAAVCGTSVECRPPLMHRQTAESDNTVVVVPKRALVLTQFTCQRSCK